MDSNTEDEASRDSNFSLIGSDCSQYEHRIISEKRKKNISVINKLFGRELYGRFTRNPRAKTEKIYEEIPDSCNRLLSEVLPEWDSSNAMQHIYMGFTICGQYLLSYTWTTEEDLQSITLFSIIYYLCVWRYAPGHRLTLVSKQKIFRHYRPQEFLDVTFSQWPTDREKIVAYGVNISHPSDAYITVILLPTLQKCEDCFKTKQYELNEMSPCLRHNVTIDFMLNITTPYPVYNPIMHLAYPDHIVINTGHYLYVINVSFVVPKSDSDPQKLQFLNSVSDNINVFSDFQENDNSKTNIVEAIIQDFSEYDLEGNECLKPFHELNISCEPLNVTGKSYFNTNSYSNTKSYLLINAQCSSYSNNNSNSSAKSIEKSKIDKKIAEKAYEFTEDNEKCEKLSSFRKKRLADKKYEFSEDNSENIIPFQLLRQERRFLLRNQNRYLRSPVSPKQNGLKSPRSPMLSPNNRNCQSPSSPRHYCPSLRLSPRESTKKFNVYSPNLETECSDSDSKLVLRQITNVPTKVSDFCELKTFSSSGLLIIDGKRIEEKPRWIRNVVKRYCNMDFENASLISDIQGRDDYLCIDLPTLVYTANNIQIDSVPSRINDVSIGPHLKITQKTFDSEQFCQRRAEKLCAESHLKFSHCEDYDIKIEHICPLSGDIICTAELKIGAVDEPQENQQPQPYTTSCMFVWNMCTDSYKVLNSDDTELSKLTTRQKTERLQSVRLDEIPNVACKKVRYMTHNFEKSLQYLRDSENYIQISMDKTINGFLNYTDDDFIGSYNYNTDLSDLEDIF